MNILTILHQFSHAANIRIRRVMLACKPSILIFDIWRSAKARSSETDSSFMAELSKYPNLPIDICKVAFLLQLHLRLPIGSFPNLSHHFANYILRKQHIQFHLIRINGI